MNTEKVISRDNDYILHTYGRSQVVLAEGEGMTARDADGKSYLDFTSGIGVNSLGYCHPAWVRAVADQAATLQHTSNLYYTAPDGKLAKKLCRRTGLDAVFFGNSGAEANEGAIKCARKYSVDTYGESRNKVITLVNSFHGRTLATLTATGQDVFHHDFGPFPGNFDYVPAGDFAALEKAADKDTCAVMMELVQGEGGVVALDADYVARVAAFCREKDILVIVDEVQTGVGPKDLQGKAVALVFAKNSTRTRTSLEVGIYQMGGLGTYLSASDLQTARGEPVQDTARVLGRYYDAIVCRTYKQTTLDMLAKYSGIPVVSGMTDYAHPLQVLTDLMTVRERKGTLAGLKAGFVGDGYNMANSVIVGCLAVGMTVTIACPKGYRPAADVLMLAKQYGDKFTLTNDPDEAARDADVLFTDVWVSMGMEREAEQRRRDFTGFTLDAARMALAKPDCMVQHPLPAHRGEEIAPDVLEAHADEIFDEAENRIYVEKAVLAVLLAGK